MKKYQLITIFLCSFVFMGLSQTAYSEELEELSLQQSRIEQMKDLVSYFFILAEDSNQIEETLNEILNKIIVIEERIQDRFEEVENEERTGTIEVIEDWEEFTHPYYDFKISFPSDWWGTVDDYNWSPGSIGISDSSLAFSSPDDEVRVRGTCPGCPGIVEAPILLFVCEEGSWKSDEDCTTEEGFTDHYYANFMEPKIEESIKRTSLEVNEEAYRVELILFDDNYEEVFDNMAFSYSEEGTSNGFYKNEEDGFQLDYQESLEFRDSREGYLLNGSVSVEDNTRLIEKNFTIEKREEEYEDSIEYYCEQGTPNTFMTSFGDIDFCQHTLYEEVDNDTVINQLVYHIIINEKWITFNFNYLSCNPSYSEDCQDLSPFDDEEIEEESREVLSTFKLLE